MITTKKYAVHKYYGNFWQCWNIEASSEEDAWNRAEKDGTLNFQNVYSEPQDLESKGYVVDLEEVQKENPPIPKEQYWKWMKEAIEKGMKVNPWEYEKVYGLPFHDVW